MTILEMKGADTVVQTCSNVKAGETVLIVTDPALFDVAEDRGVRPRHRCGDRS